MIKTVIIEDEEIAAVRLQKIAQEVNPDIVITKIIATVSEAILYLSNNKPDLIFLDINLTDGYSFDIFEQVEIKTPIIFTTAYSEYAIKAFEQNSIDYLLKPISKETLAKSINKYLYLRNEATPNYREVLSNRPEIYKKRFLVKINNQLKTILVDDIAYFYSEDRLTFTIKKDGTRIPLSYPLKKLETLLNPTNFFRINRQFIVHSDSIKDMYYTSKSRIKITLHPAFENDSVIVAIEKIGDFKKWLSL